MWLYILFAIFCYKLVDFLLRIPKTSSPTGKRDYILITGCDSGFGNLLAKRLDSKGFHVFAACLTEPGKTELDDATSPKLQAFIMNVTDKESIQNGYEFVTSSLPSGMGLWALMNNAGIAGPTGPSEWLTLQDFQQVLDVNFLALVQVTNTFLPLLKRSRGRVVNTSSCLGRLAAAHTAPYVASKHAVEGYSSALRMELKSFDISVHLIEPGYFSTRITNADNLSVNLHQKWDQLPTDMKAEYGVQYLEAMKKGLIDASGWASFKLDLVVDAYEHAALGTFPRARYLVGYHARFIFWPLMVLPEWLADSFFMKLSKLPVPDRVLEKRNA